MDSDSYCLLNEGTVYGMLPNLSLINSAVKPLGSAVMAAGLPSSCLPQASRVHARRLLAFDETTNNGRTAEHAGPETRRLQEEHQMSLDFRGDGGSYTVNVELTKPK